MSSSKPSQPNRILFFIVILLVIVLALKYMKQYVYLSFTLLSLKFVWAILVVLAVLALFRKKNPDA